MPLPSRFSVVGICRFFSPRRQHIGNSKKIGWTFWKGGTLQHFLQTDFFWTCFLEGWDFEVSVKTGGGGLRRVSSQDAFVWQDFYYPLLFPLSNTP